MQYLSENLFAWLVTYAMHSTLLLGGAWLLFASFPKLKGELRELVWKWAMVGSVATATLQFCLPLPRWFGDLPLSPEACVAAQAQSATDVDDPKLTAREAQEIAPTVRASELIPVSAQENIVPSTLVDVFSSSRPWAMPLLAGAWFVVSGIFLVRLASRLWRLRGLSGTVCRDTAVLDVVSRLKGRLGLSSAVQVIETADGAGPMAAGLFRLRVYCPREWLKSLARCELEALLAHELAHLSRRDAWWNLAGEAACALFFFQPLNLVARRKIREQAEFLADQRAAEVLADGLGLARCLVLLAESPRFAHHGWQTAVAVGMAAYRSQLGRRVELLCESERQKPISARARRLAAAALLGILLIVPLLAPGAVARPRERNPGETAMQSNSWKMAALLTAAIGIATPAPAQDEKPDKKPAAEVKQRPLSAEERTKFPEGARGLSGRLVGRLVKKDAEKGELTLENVKVDRVWPGSKASAPKGLDGRTVRIEKVFGRFLDVLLTLKEGDGVQIEVKHVSGDGLVFLGEELKKVALDEQPRDKPQEDQPKPKEKDEPKKPAEPRGNDTADAPPGMAGFRGLLVGELVSADAEKGSFVVKLEKVKRTWAQNKAPAPEKSVGKNVAVEGVFGKFLDVLITLKPGDKVEFEAFHVRGQALKFPGEWLKKAEAESAK